MASRIREMTPGQRNTSDIMPWVEQRSVVMTRVASVAEAATVARLLDAFNREYSSPTPGTAVLATRLRQLMIGRETVAVLAGDPAVAVALLTLRPNVWYEGPVALLDELYVAPELRGRGIGSALLTAAETVVRERGGTLLEINVDGADTGARRFYERHGYTNTEPGQHQPLLYYYRELTDTPVQREDHRNISQSDPG
jgi:GNAT superfamily N-acetyltransferase